MGMGERVPTGILRKRVLKISEREQPAVQDQEGLWSTVATDLLHPDLDIETVVHGHSVPEVPGSEPISSSSDPVADMITASGCAVWSSTHPSA